MVQFDPSLHRALTDMQVGEPAVIHECGFMLHEASANTVLLRATVSSESSD